MNESISTVLYGISLSLFQLVIVRYNKVSRGHHIISQHNLCAANSTVIRSVFNDQSFDWRWVGLLFEQSKAALGATLIILFVATTHHTISNNC